MGSALHPRVLLEQIARHVDHRLLGHPGHVAVFVELRAHDVELGFQPLSTHPIDELARVVAPPPCWGVLLRTTGRAHLLDKPDRGPDPIVSTYGRTRQGYEVSLLRRGSSVTELTGPAEGRIPDLVKRILGDTP